MPATRRVLEGSGVMTNSASTWIERQGWRFMVGLGGLVALIGAVLVVMPAPALAQAAVANTTYYTWDPDRRLKMVVHPVATAGATSQTVTQYLYDSDGQLTEEDVGTVTSSTAASASPAFS